MEASASAIGTRFAPRIPAALFRLGDERLARLVAVGHERAFALLYERYHQPLYRYLRSMLGQDADAQDALQSAFASAFAALKAGRRNAPLRPWLFRIAHNEAISSLRSRRPQAELTDTVASPAPSPEEQVIESERLRLLVADLADLSDRQRGALVMREFSGLSHEDIACALDMSVGAAKQTVFEARRALLERAEGRAMACEEIQRIVSDGDKRALRGRRVRAHLRSCPACAAFGASIEARRADQLALSPALPAGAASALFAQITGVGLGHVSGGGGVLGGVTSKTASVVMSGKAFTAGVAVLATTAVGATGVLHQITASHGTGGAGTRNSIRADSGRNAAGASTARGSATGRFRQESIPTGSAHLIVGGGVNSTPLPSTASGGAVLAAHRGAAAPSPPGHIASQSARTGANHGTRRMTGRPSGSTHARAPGAGRSQRATRGSARATHGSSKAAGGSQRPARSVTSPSPHRNGEAGPPALSTTPSSRASRALNVASLASPGTQLTPRPPSAK